MKWKLFSVLAVAGFASGLMLSGLSGGESYCSGVEKEVETNSSFNGSISCYPPGVVEVNQSEKIEEGSDVRCVCIKSWGQRHSISIVRFSN